MDKEVSDAPVSPSISTLTAYLSLVATFKVGKIEERGLHKPKVAKEINGRSFVNPSRDSI